MSFSQAILFASGVFLFFSSGWCLETSHQAPDDFLNAWLEGNISFSGSNRVQIGSAFPSSSTPAPSPMLHPRASLLPFELSVPRSDASYGTIAWKDLYILKPGPQQDRLDVFLHRAGKWTHAGSLPNAEIADTSWYEGTLFVLMRPRSALPTSTHLYRVAVSPSGSIAQPELAALAPAGVQAEQIGVTREGLFITARIAGENSRRLYHLRGLEDSSPGWSDCGMIPAGQDIPWHLLAIGSHLFLAHPGTRTVQVCRKPRTGDPGEWISEILPGGEWQDSLKKYVSIFSRHEPEHACLVHEFHLPPGSFLQGLRLSGDPENLPPIRWRLAKTGDSIYSDWSDFALEDYIPVQDHGEVLQYQLVEPRSGEPAGLQRVSLLWTQGGGRRRDGPSESNPSSLNKPFADSLQQSRPGLLLPPSGSGSGQDPAETSPGENSATPDPQAADSHSQGEGPLHNPSEMAAATGRNEDAFDLPASPQNSLPDSGSKPEGELESPQSEPETGCDTHSTDGISDRGPNPGGNAAPAPQPVHSPPGLLPDSEPSPADSLPENGDTGHSINAPEDSLPEAASDEGSSAQSMDTPAISPDAGQETSLRPIQNGEAASSIEAGNPQISKDGTHQTRFGSSTPGDILHQGWEALASVPLFATEVIHSTTAQGASLGIKAGGVFVPSLKSLLPFLLPLLVLLILTVLYHSARSQAHRTIEPFHLTMNPAAWERERKSQSESENRRAFQSVPKTPESEPAMLALPALRTHFSPDSSKVAAWRVAEPLPEPMAPAAAFYRQGQVILVGTNGTLCQARLRADGSLCPWGIRLGHLPAGGNQKNIAVLENAIALLSHGKLYAAPLKPDGIGDWKAIGSAPKGMEEAAVVGSGDQIYFLGSRKRGRALPTVQSARLLPDGKLGKANPQPPLPECVTGGGLATARNRIYWLGGLFSQGPSQCVYSAKIDSGDLAEWRKEADLPWPVTSPMVTTDGLRIWVAGRSPGLSGTEVACGFLDSEGHPSGWWRIDDQIPAALFDGSFTFAGGHLLALGGWLDPEKKHQSAQVFALSTL